MQHRGPDASDIREMRVGGVPVVLGHVRLSIHDLSEAANQPFTSDCGRYHLVYNGEIYNFKELVAELLPRQVFRTSSDTEVLFYLLINYREKVLNDLDGMFSFCFLDTVDQTVLVARDQLGIKPCYYVQTEQGVAVGSEIKALLKAVNIRPKMSRTALYQFLRNSFIYEPETGFEGVKKLPSGHFVILNVTANGEISPLRYWHPSEMVHNSKFSQLQYDNPGLFDRLRESIDIQQRADVPVGLFFSGGVDSSLLLANLKDSDIGGSILSVKTNKKLSDAAGATDDYEYSISIAKHLDAEVTPIEFSPSFNVEQFFREVRECAIGVEELVADFTFSVSKKLAVSAREKNCVVMLSGMGADEIFGGYEKYRLVRYPTLFKWIYRLGRPLVRSLPRLQKKIGRLEGFLQAPSFAQKYTNMLGYFSKDEVSQMIGNVEKLDVQYATRLEGLMSPSNSFFKNSMLADLHGFLQHNFTVADKSTMQASIELRVPFATPRLFEAAFATADSKLLDLRRTKKPLRKFLKASLPTKYTKRRKAGFHPPMDTVIDSAGYERILSEFDKLELGRVICREFYESLLKDHFSGKRNNTYQIFQLLFFGNWYEYYVEGDVS